MQIVYNKEKRPTKDAFLSLTSIYSFKEWCFIRGSVHSLQTGIFHDRTQCRFYHSNLLLLLLLLPQQVRNLSLIHIFLVFQIINYLTDHAQEDNNQQTARGIYEKFYVQFQEIEPATDYRRLNFRIRKPDIRNLRFRFALRQVIVLTPCLVLAYLWQTNNIYWLVISVFFMMIPFTEYTMQRVRQRVFGTMAGIVLSFILFTVFPDFTSRVVIMTAANFLIYAADGYGPTVAFITCSALALQLSLIHISASVRTSIAGTNCPHLPDSSKRSDSAGKRSGGRELSGTCCTGRFV